MSQNEKLEAAPVGVPDGWQLVPKEPTPEMCEAGYDAAPQTSAPCEPVWPTVCRDIYKAMLASAPQSVPAGTRDDGIEAAAKWFDDQAALHDQSADSFRQRGNSTADLNYQNRANEYREFAKIIRNLKSQPAPAGRDEETIEAALLKFREALASMLAPINDQMTDAEYRALARTVAEARLKQVDAILKSTPSLQGGGDTKWFTDSDDKIERDELRRLFGNEMPLEAGQLLFGAEPGLTLRELRAKIASIAASQPAPAVSGEGWAFDFRAHLARQREFSFKTFGPGTRTQGVVDHIRKELAEIEADPSDILEWIDVVILALDGAWRAGYSPDQIIEAIVAKQDKNEAREWPDWRTADPDKAIEHNRHFPSPEGRGDA